MADERIQYPKDTLFLVTESDYDQKIMRAAIAAKYANVPRDMIATAFNMARIQHLPQISFIVCTRNIAAEDGSPGEVQEIDALGRMSWKPVHPSKYIKEIEFSRPLKVGDLIKVSGVSLSSSGGADINPLLAAIAECAWPYRIFPENPPDVMCRIMGRQ